MNNLRIINGLLFQKNSSGINEFEKLYISLRKKEGRIFNEKEIGRLPDVDSSHPHYKEWKIRKNSCNHLLKYIKKQGHICSILEVGCGNGWLTAQLSAVTTGEVIGIDINSAELNLAKKVFRQKHNLSFLTGDICTGILADKKFDLIVFAASIQYFKSLKEIIKIALQYLTLQGEIHILDSHFYTQSEILPASKRTKKYFSQLGFPCMSQFYFHHSLHELKSFNYTFLFNPRSWINKLLFRKKPFYWIVIKNHYT
ncbi:MAG TPA: class I SAM-dependent methyltransferase [Hanamia sp.]|nr:class I SAM-dependent methyltransferase [Hanamia sp.]